MYSRTRKVQVNAVLFAIASFQPLEQPIVSGFFAYPSKPQQVGATIRNALKSHNRNHASSEIRDWSQNEIAGSFILDPILDEISASDIVFGDITGLNFNVLFELGYAIGLQKRVVPVRFAAIRDDQLIREVGLFDTIGFESYTQESGLCEILKKGYDRRPLAVSPDAIETTSPVYVVLPSVMTDIESRLLSRIKKARLHFRSFNPSEVGRMSALSAISDVCRSAAIAMTYQPINYEGALVHNTRVAFTAGLAFAMNKTLVMLSTPDETIALDFRDMVKPVKSAEDVDPHIASMASEVTATLQLGRQVSSRGLNGKLRSLNLGASAAENELSELENYFVKTDEFSRVLRGEAQILSGRKGAGKTALFIQVRNEIRKTRGRIVLDLMPEGYQLLRFKESVLDLMAEGAREHTVSAFWEYLLLLEMCHKIVRNDRERHMRDHTLFPGYKQIKSIYGEDKFVSESDFSERLRLILTRIADEFRAKYGDAAGVKLSDEEVNLLIYKHSLPELRNEVFSYLEKRGGVWILVDNLDRGWPASGLTPQDAMILRALTEAIKRIGKEMRERGIDGFGTVFLRDDVYESFVAGASDRAKSRRLAVDWEDGDLLREILRRRIVASLDVNPSTPFTDVWAGICCSHIDGEESSQFLIDRCLMRPRALIDIVNSCKSHAVNLGRDRMEADDLREGVRQYSKEILENINFEIQDVLPKAVDILYAFVEAPRSQHEDDILLGLLEQGLSDTDAKEVLDYLMYYAVLGIEEDEQVRYIYNFGYDRKKMRAVASNRRQNSLRLAVNPAFWGGFDTKL